jgi:hypothetical protein
MWDLTVPGNNDHDFYVHADDTDILVHNCGTTAEGESEPPGVLSVGGPRVRPGGDIPVDAEGNVSPPTPGQLAAKDVNGLSTFDTPEHAAAENLTGQLRAPSKALPDGLGFIADGADVGGPAPEGHFTIFPTSPMSFDNYMALIKSMDWQNIGQRL